jgi:glycosyltransferase involved in cell wall biosynthesis
MNPIENIVAVIPVYNEEDRIEDTIKALKKIEVLSKIVIIDDGSTDNTLNVVRTLNVDCIKLDKNCGKGYAIKKAIEELNFDILVLVDGDLGESSSEVEKLIYPVVNNESDVTIAKFPRPLKKGGFGLVKKLAKYGVYMYTGKKIDTTLSGQRVYKKEVIDKITYIPDRFGIEVAMTVQTLKNGYNINEIDVNMRHRETGRSMNDFLHRGKQFWDILKTLVLLSFKR